MLVADKSPYAASPRFLRGGLPEPGPEARVGAQAGRGGGGEDTSKRRGHTARRWKGSCGQSHTDSLAANEFGGLGPGWWNQGTGRGMKAGEGFRMQSLQETR